WLVAFFGIQRYGATVAPLNLEVNAKNLGQMLRDLAPRLVVRARELPAEGEALVGASGGEAGPPADLRAKPGRSPTPPTAPRRGGRREDVGVVEYASGTRAIRRGVCISHRAAFYMGRSLVERLGIGEHDRLLEYRSLSWASAQCLSLWPSIQAGATLVLAPRF